MRHARVAGLVLTGLVATLQVVSTQPASTPDALGALVATEQAFAARALEVGWKQAFLDYFADEAIAFNTGAITPARPGLAAAPDPHPDLQLVWEPRTGDVAARGDLGWLTGPAVTRRATTPPGEGNFSTYASVWKRQADGRFPVVADVGINTPAEPAFAPGFTRVPAADRWTGGDPEGALETLRAADADLTRAASDAGPAAWGARLAPAGRLHLPGRLPLVGEAEVREGAGTWTGGTALGAETAAAGDLGWAWGTWVAAEDGGHYLRVWARGADGTWRLALEVRQPAPPGAPQAEVL
jgi:ketosteroid isomerase-like protein